VQVIMGARLPPLLLLALLAGSAARVHARCINDNQQGSVLSASKVHGRPVEQPGCACKPQEPECKCDVSGWCYCIEKLRHML